MNLPAASLCALILSAEGGAPAPPVELACPARHYAVQAAFDDGQYRGRQAVQPARRDEGAEP